MPLTISAINVTLHGRAADDITTLEVDGAGVAIASDRTWSTTVSIPGSGERTVAITAFGPTRRETRLVEVGAGSAPTAPG